MRLLVGLQSRFQSYKSLQSFNHQICLTVQPVFLHHLIRSFAMALIAEDIKNATKLLGTDLIIAYGLPHIYSMLLTVVTG